MLQDTGSTAAIAREPDGKWSEIVQGWPVLLGSAIGIAVGIMAFPKPIVGIFMKQWQAEFGWSRTEISIGPTVLIVTLALISPLLGWIADRVSARLLIGVSLSALSVGMFLFSRMGGDLMVYYLGFAALAVAASGSATVVYAKAITAAFDRTRGLALGLAMTGIGVSGVLLPLLMVPYAASAGWRAGYVAIAGVIAVAVPVVSLLMGPGQQAAVVKRSPTAPSVGTALRERSFWILAACVALIPIAASGLSLHLIAMLTDMGLSPLRTGEIASVAGISLAIGRILTGYLIDRLFAPLVAAAMMGLSALAVALLAVFGEPVAILGAVAVGLSLGAELDLVGYLTARYFGLERFGRIYGLLYAAILVGMSLSPIMYGYLFDTTGSYRISLFVAAALLGTSALLFLMLPPFTHAGTD